MTNEAKPLSAQKQTTALVDDVAAGAFALHHHAVLLVGSRLPEGGLPASTFALFALTHCGIVLPGSPDADDFWQRAAGHPDVVIVDREAKLIKLAEVAPIRERALFAPTQGRRRLFFVDACERLSVPSANALLKVLEEPAAPCLFLFTAQNPRNVLPTIASRCQRIPVRFVPPGVDVPSGPLESLEPEDAKSLREHFLSTPRRVHTDVPAQATTFAPDSLASRPRPGAQSLGRLVERAEALGKKYDASTLADACLQAALEAHRASAFPLRDLRFLKEDLRAWRNGLAYNPSNALWLCRILLRAR
ncbi:MAG: hypothetical protein IOD12_12480 [Silvanigrellales bacterium]|nr:hypothetical protein [Silvanigrellales bacterium]